MKKARGKTSYNKLYMLRPPSAQDPQNLPHSSRPLHLLPSGWGGPGDEGTGGLIAGSIGGVETIYEFLRCVG